MSKAGVMLQDLLDPNMLEKHIKNGYVRRQVHPAALLYILNYTEKTQFEDAWDDVTRQCRGLIVAGSGEIVGRPWAKFYNHGQPGAAALDLTAPAEVTNKADGSLGILYPAPDGYAIATRGSFTSPQALHATRVLREHPRDFTPPDGMTLLFEIIYPENRIVVDYQGLDALVLLGAVDIATGRTVGPSDVPGWRGLLTETYQAATLAEALAMPPRPNAEGVVVRLVDTGAMVKIKQADYLALHRIMTQTTARTVWEFVAVNECKDLIHKPKHWGSLLGLDPARAAEVIQAGPDWLQRITADVPDEFHAWLRETIDGLYEQARLLRRSLGEELAPLVEKAAGDRVTLWNLVRDHPYFGLLMHLHDGRDVTTQIWRAIYPPPTKPWAARSEDVA